MTTSNRRIALLTGASISALGMSALVASPALAAPHDDATGVGGYLAAGTYTGIDTSTATLTICEISADVDAVPNSPCFTGVIDTTNPAFAQVNAPTNGQIFQHDAGATITLDMVNAGSAEVGAIAYATGLTGATAHAYNTIPIRQTADGGDVDLTIDNNGPLLLDAVATASAVTGADARAFVHGALQAVGTAGADYATLTFNNNDDMTVLASANAHAVFANAYATVQFGVAQTGFFGANNADFEFNNNGNLDVTAVANADGIFAHAGAYVTGGGITQYATANGGLHSANVAVNNSADGVDQHRRHGQRQCGRLRLCDGLSQRRHFAAGAWQRRRRCQRGDQQ